MEKDHVYFAKPGAEYNKEDSRSIDGNSFVAYRKHEAARGDISTRPDL